MGKDAFHIEELKCGMYFLPKQDGNFAKSLKKTYLVTYFSFLLNSLIIITPEAIYC